MALERVHIVDMVMQNNTGLIVCLTCISIFYFLLFLGFRTCSKFYHCTGMMGLR